LKFFAWLCMLGHIHVRGNLLKKKILGPAECLCPSIAARSRLSATFCSAAVSLAPFGSPKGLLQIHLFHFPMRPHVRFRSSSHPAPPPLSAGFAFGTFGSTGTMPSSMGWLRRSAHPKGLP
jgi:hypothetical protein